MINYYQIIFENVLVFLGADDNQSVCETDLFLYSSRN